MTDICDYEGSRYRQEFWASGARAYEDLAERIAVRAMLPSGGKRIVEIGAGFGRLVDLYESFEEIFLVDYARTQLEEAQRYLGERDNVTYVMADVYRLPFVPNAFDALLMVRVMHHLVDVPAALHELQRVVSGEGVAVIEHASKRHLKAILRWVLRLQSWNPFSPVPEEFVPLNFDFDPAWMRKQFQSAGFDVTDVRTVSHFRIPLLKRIFPAKFLARLDGWAQPTGKWWQLTPSVFLQAKPQKAANDAPLSKTVFLCPNCHSNQLTFSSDGAECDSCGTMWAKQGGIYNFREPQNKA